MGADHLDNASQRGTLPPITMKKVKFNVCISPELAQEVRAVAFLYRLTLGDFFEAAALRELERLRTSEPQLSENKLRAGRPIRPHVPEKKPGKK